MMALYFLVLVAVGILRSVRNALALDGLAEGDFYQVYFVSALVVLFAPIFNRLAKHFPWRVLIPASAGFFALNLVIFRAVYQEGSAAFGMIFYGWYDLFAAALVTQFFMAIQLSFNSRDAKSAVPLVIAVGSLGVVFGSLITGFFAETLGSPNLLLVAAVFVGVFAVSVRFFWEEDASTGDGSWRSAKERQAGGGLREVREVFSHPHIRLIARLVLVTVLVKQIVDFEFNEAVRVFLGGERDSMSSFQGFVYAAQNALPILVLLPLGPLLKRYGVGLAVMILPVTMLGFTTAMALAFGVWSAVLAKAGDAMFRYSAERASREVLYVPVPTDLKLKAKTYVDVALEKGVGKALSGVLLFVLSMFLDYQKAIWVAVLLCIPWCYMAWSAKREYVRVLADSIRGRFANLSGGFASLTERSTLALVEQALRSEDVVEVEFGLDLVEQAGTVDAKHLADELELLLKHADSDVRARALMLLARFPELVADERIRECLEDDDVQVAEAAVGALVAGDDAQTREQALADLLDSPRERVRIAALSWMIRDVSLGDLGQRLASRRVDTLLAGASKGAAPGAMLASADAGGRRELALACGVLRSDARADEILGRLLDDEDPVVSGLAIRSVGRSGSSELQARLVSMLSQPGLRGRVKGGLLGAAPAMVDLCRARLVDAATDPSVRTGIAQVLAHVPEQAGVDALMSVVADGGTPWETRRAAVKALSKLRARADVKLVFDRASAIRVAEDMVDDAERYLTLAAALEGEGAPSDAPAVLLRTAAWDTWMDRRETVFRLLGLVFPPDEVYRSHGTLGGADDRKKANALEWLERTLGHALFRRVLPVLDGAPTIGERRRANDAPIERFVSDPDRWIAELAEETAQRRGGDSMDVIGKAFLLQKVDLLEGARSAHLGLLASIAEEVEAETGEVLVRAGEPNDALYVIVRGSVELSGVADQTLTVGDGTAFGTWSLIDSAPSVVGARALEPTRVLRITRGNFQELLSDHPELATGMLQALARRLRSLVA